MDEYTLGTSTVICVYGCVVEMVVTRTYGEVIWYRGLPVVFFPGGCAW
jgi:hypothetical protein